CHSHKFDPIPQEDYYRLMAVFTPAYNPQAWRPVIPFEPKVRDRALPDISPAELTEIERNNAAVDRRVDELRRELSQLRQRRADRLFESRLGFLPEAIRADTKTALRIPAEKRTEVQKYLAAKFADSLTIKPEEVTASLSPQEKATLAGLEAQIATTQA